MAGTSTTSHRKDTLCTLWAYVQAFSKFLCSKVELVVVHKVVIAFIVWWVDINHLHFATIRLYQML